MREFDLPERNDAGSTTDGVADRLDELQMDAVERVLRRAIELQSDGELAPDTLDGDAVKKIAEELGIASHHVERALFEEQIGEQVVPPTLMDRILAPPRLSGETTVTAPRPAVEEAADLWLGRHEGLRKRRIVPDGAVWEKDPSALTSIRMGLKLSNGSGALRSAGDVAHRIHSAPSGEQIVGIDVDVHKIANTGRGLLMAGASFGALLVVLMAVNFGWRQGIAAGLATFGAFATVAVVSAKTWAGRIRNGIRRALDAIASPQTAGVHDTAVDRVSRLIDAWTDLGRTVRRKL